VEAADGGRRCVTERLHVSSILFFFFPSGLVWGESVRRVAHGFHGGCPRMEGRRDMGWSSVDFALAYLHTFA
jgi:hypothetical protein